MKVIFGLRGIEKYKKAVVILGVFDGVHLAHRRILNGAAGFTKRINGKSILVTFWPHPQGEENIYSLEHRLKLIAGFGIQACIVIRFNRKFAKIPAEKFISDILVKKIRAAYIYIGKNFTFGKDALGDSALLEKLSAVYGFKLKVFDIIKANHLNISSSAIRSLIKKGNLEKAAKLLGRKVSVLGTVIHGESLAGKLGFPTANINPHHEVLPPAGVYCVKVIFKRRKFGGVCSIGTKPTLDGKQQYIEVHIFNFNKNLYSEDLEILFIRKLRNQKKFTSLSSLARQIKKDISISKRILSRH